MNRPARSREIDIATFDRNTPIRLDVAARAAFPDGSVSLSSLRREAARGRLTIWRIANKDMTTLAEIGSMIERCRVQPNRPDSGSDPHREIEPPSGSSSIADVNTALVAARMRAKRLKESLPSISAPNTTPKARGSVVLIKPL